MTEPRRGQPTEPTASIAWENRQRRRYELIDGAVRLMSGGTLAHDLISGNIAAALRMLLAGLSCFVHGTSLKVHSPVGMVTYPDVFVRCGNILDEDATEIDDPLVIVEVLSPGTRGEDLVTKRWAYQAIPSLLALFYVEPKTAKVELCTKEQDGTWRGRFVEGVVGDVPLESLSTALPIRAVYAGTKVVG